MTTEAMRAQFEAWLVAEHGYTPDDLIWHEARNCYVGYAIHLAWEAYQAALRSPAVAGLVEALQKYTAAGFGNSTDFYKQKEAYDAAVEALSNFTGATIAKGEGE